MSHRSPASGTSKRGTLKDLPRESRTKSCGRCSSLARFLGYIMWFILKLYIVYWNQVIFELQLRRLQIQTWGWAAMLPHILSVSPLALESGGVPTLSRLVQIGKGGWTSTTPAFASLVQTTNENTNEHARQRYAGNSSWFPGFTKTYLLDKLVPQQPRVLKKPLRVWTLGRLFLLTKRRMITQITSWINRSFDQVLLKHWITCYFWNETEMRRNTKRNSSRTIDL